MKRRPLLLKTLAAMAFCTLLPSATRAAPPAPQFHRDVRPILSNFCYRCHGPDAETRAADLRLDQREGLFGNSSSDAPIVKPGDVEASELLRRITSHDDAERMPPPDANLELSPAQIETLKSWITAGADWQNHWAYQPPTRPELPAAPSQSANLDHPIDRFLAAALAREGLALSVPADPITLARRLSFDLLGLPPSADEVTEFAADPSEQAYDALVERLLDSPHYGERMAVHWLDLVRYADSCGYHSDVEQPISPYRDYVIEAFNRNLPFDQFTREQLAGDLLENPSIEQRVATGYNRLNKTTEEGGAQAGEYTAKSAADRVRTTAGVWLAATLGCAECHDHKYDPYTARDFYSFAAFFADVQEQGVYKAGTREPELKLPNADQLASAAELNEQLAACTQQLAAIGEAENDAPQRDELQKQEKQLRAKLQKLEASYPRTMITVSTTPREMRILPRGNWLDATGEVVSPALPAAFAPAPTSDRRLTRLDLADWLTARENPVVARVFVNRLWKLFFGAGLARQLDDFGAQGEPPTHPELLDWLAVEFIDSGWDVKYMIRLITSSRAYRQSSIPTAELVKRDPQNRLLARQSRWRLDAEFIRDTALVHAGLLVPEVGGASVKPYQPEGYWEFLNFPKRTWRPDEGSNQYRRGLYTHWQRTFLHPSLLAFDAPSREECTAQRAVSNTPQAALALLNDPTYIECSRKFAERTLTEPESADDASRIAWAFRQAVSRVPSEDEQKLLAELLAASRAQFEADKSAAEKLLAVGQSPRSTELDSAELAAWTGVCRTVLNLHETISRN